MVKTIAEHLEDLRRSRTRATLENILSDFEQSGNRVLEEYARVVKRNLRDNAGEEGARMYFVSAERMLEDTFRWEIGERAGAGVVVAAVL
jgi:hypothetical protein